MALPILILLLGIAMTILGYKFESLDGGRAMGPLFIIVGLLFTVGAAIG